MFMQSLLAATMLAALPPAPQGADPAASAQAPAAEQAAPAVQSGDVDPAVVESVSTYLSNLDSVQARFLQINPDGSAYEGDLYIDRPGKARFDYDDYPLLIVSDGATVAQRDEALETTDRVALKSTPLFYLLKENVNLSADAKVIAAGQAEDMRFVTLQDPSDQFDGELTLYFSQPSLELREWMATDALGQETRFVLTEVNRAGEFDPRLFTLDNEAESDRGRGRR